MGYTQHPNYRVGGQPVFISLCLSTDLSRDCVFPGALSMHPCQCAGFGKSHIFKEVYEIVTLMSPGLCRTFVPARAPLCCKSDGRRCPPPEVTGQVPWAVDSCSMQMSIRNTWSPEPAFPWPLFWLPELELRVCSDIWEFSCATKEKSKPVQKCSGKS